MANQEDLARLKEGVKTWNTWRRQHLEVWVDLEGAHLCEANLCGVDLRYSLLSWSDLSGADLHKADLSGSDLRWADLSGASIYGTTFKKACLQGAKLEQALVRTANLQGADLRGIPRLIIMELMLQPAVNTDGIQWDCPIDEKGV